ncbi:GspH/FimT family pseudopilin [Psychrobacter ciconiae]|uniref:GspH/FimT family pseudopilin n=1 Tax=Psychrobacter ciconiae TaxID=1553449 RepID=UPI001D122044|nr:GspH/FimT family pseudopilin [Psychrobacter ciconiae]
MSKSQGFTLIELMVTIAVLAIIVSIAAPNISTQLANQRVKSTTSTLESALKEARAESVIRRQNIAVTINNSNDIVVTDSNSNKIASYSYDKKSEVSATISTIVFTSHKTADQASLTICDSNQTANPRLLQVSNLGIITSKIGGSC